MFGNGLTLPANDADNAYMYLSQLPAVVDMLRNESPIMYQYDSSNGQACVQTGELENVGENDATPGTGSGGVTA